MAEVIERITRSPDETRSIGASLGRALAPGTLVLLEGPFGAGKTVLVQGMAEALGIDEPVTSPSFVLMTEHVGKQKLVHVDFFRIERAAPDLHASIEEYLDDGWIVAVEWPDWLPTSLASEAVRVRLEPVSETERRITVSSKDAAVLAAIL